MAKAVKDTNTEQEINELKSKLDMFYQMFGDKMMNNTSSNDVDTSIEFESVSLSPLYLSTKGNGNGEIYSFDTFGEKQNIPYIDARDIIRNNKSFIQAGLVYIHNEDFVKKENLNKYYNNIIDAESIEALVSSKRAEFGTKYSKLTQAQKDVVCGILFEKLKNGKKVDEEVLFYIQQYNGKNLKQEVKDYQELLKNDEE